MRDTVVTVIVLVGIYVVLPVVLLLARDRFTRPRNKDLDEYSRQFHHRLQHPDFAAVERHFCHPLPACVQALYADHHELLRSDFEVAVSIEAEPKDRWYVAYYQPADEQSVRDGWPGFESYFAFADDGCGNAYLIIPTSDDPPIFFLDHETGKLTPVCERFTQFMQWPRLEPRE